MLTINKRGLARIVAPATEPLTLAETKLYLRVDGIAEDALITDFISVACEHAENYLRRSLLTQHWRLTLADYAPECVRLPMGPVQSIVAINLLAQDGTSTIFSDTLYALDTTNGVLNFSTTPYGYSVQIDYVAGLNNAADLPKSIRYGMLAHIAAMFDQRGSDGVGMPEDSRALYTPHREVTL